MLVDLKIQYTIFLNSSKLIYVDLMQFKSKYQQVYMTTHGCMQLCLCEYWCIYVCIWCIYVEFHKLNLKFIWKRKGPRITKTLMKKKMMEDLVY